MKILVVDDQYENRYLLVSLLGGYGYTVITAENGEDALSVLEKDGIDLIISDILLPRMDGFQLCREVKTHPDYRHIPFVFYSSAYTGQKDQEFGQNLGADRFILKPTDPAEFILIIQDLIKTYPHLSAPPREPVLIREEEFLSEHNQRLISQLEKKLSELERLNGDLMRSELKYRNLFESASDAIFLHEVVPEGTPGRILEVNEAACRQLGYSRDELLSLQISDITPPHWFAQFKEFLSTLPEESPLTFEGEHYSKTGTIIPVENSVRIFRDGDTLLCISISRDITERMIAMAELAGAIRQINRNLHNIAMIGDRIRNPLSIIQGYCDECDCTRREQIHEAVRTIDSFITSLDAGWVQSEKVRSVLLKIYGSEKGGDLDPTEHL